jgi:hypothetical protein
MIGADARDDGVSRWVTGPSASAERAASAEGGSRVGPEDRISVPPGADVASVPMCTVAAVLLGPAPSLSSRPPFNSSEYRGKADQSLARTLRPSVSPRRLSRR